MGIGLRDGFQRVLSDLSPCQAGMQLSGQDVDESETLELLLGSVRPWAIEAAGRINAEPRKIISPETLKAGAGLGLFGLTIPTDYEGGGLSLKAASRVMEELGQHDASLAISIGLHCAQGTQGLTHFGSESLKRTFLPKLARGEWIGAFAATEPGAGSDLTSLVAEAVPSGEGLSLSGEKIYVTNGGFADTYTVLARTPGLGGRRRGHSLLLVTRDSPGLNVGAEEDKLGLNASSTVSLRLDDVPIGIDRVIGQPGQGMVHVVQMLSWGRTLLASGCLGGARAAHARAVRQVLSRKQFKRRISGFGQVRRMIVEMQALIYAMESVVRLTGQLAARKDSDVTWESAIAKLFCSESSWRVIDDTLQLHGGSGFIEGSLVASSLRDARVLRIFEGANEMLGFHLASAALLFPEAAKDGNGCLETLSGRVAPALKPFAERFDVSYARLIKCIETVSVRVGSRLYDRQVPLRGVSDAVVALYAWLATIIRTNEALETGESTPEVALTHYLALRLEDRVRRGLLLADSELEEGLIHELSEIQYARAHE